MAGLSPFPQPPPTLLLLEAPGPMEQRFLAQFLPQVTPFIFASLLGFFRGGFFALLPRPARPLVSSATAPPTAGPASVDSCTSARGRV